MQSESFGGIVASMYEAALDLECWPAVLEDMASYVKAATAHLRIWDAVTCQVIYSAHVGGGNGNKGGASPHPPGGALQDVMPLCPDTFDDRYRRYHKQAIGLPISPGGRHLLACQADENVQTYALLGFQRDLAAPPFGCSEAESVEAFGSHLIRSVRIMRSTREQQWPDLAGTLLDRLAFGAILTNHAGQLVWANAAAQRHLALRQTLCVRNGRVEAVESSAQKRLLPLLAQATAARGCGSGLQISASEGEGAIALTVLPFTSPLRAFGTGQAPLALVLIGDLAARPAPTGRQLVDCFGLTAAEARLAVQLAQGETLESIAARHRVRDTTLRTQLRAVLQKTGTGRQADLVRLVVGLPMAHLRS